MAKKDEPLRYEERKHGTKDQAQRVNADYQRGARRFRWLRPLIWIAPLAAAVATVPFFFGGGRRVFFNGSVSRAHTVFEGSCEQCHVGNFTKVSDDTCKCCHDGPSHFKPSVVAGVKEKVGENCRDCHVEHRGRFLLADVDDDHCTKCHDNLKAHSQNLHLSSPPVPERVTRFQVGHHPDFSAFAQSDQRPLRMKHADHMLPGVSAAAGGPPQGFKRTAHGDFYGMECGDCHVSDPDSLRGDFLPITFEKTCRFCHSFELEFDDPLQSPLKGKVTVEGPPPLDGHFSKRALQYIDSMRKIGFPSPYAKHTKDQEQIKGIIQTSYSELLRNDPEVVRRTTESFLPLPSQSAWLEQRVQQASTFLFNDKCKVCHEMEQTGASYPTVKRVNVVRGRFNPDNPQGDPWLTGGTVFSHRTHRPIRCEDCHAKATASKDASEVLIPHMESCVKCHSGTGTALDRCSQCHLYHQKGQEQQIRRPGNQMTGGPACPVAASKS